MDYRWLLAAVLFTAVGASCSSQALRVVPSATTIPLVSADAPGTVLGRCLRVGPGGPVLGPCPAGLERFIGEVVTENTSGRGRYAHGIFSLPSHAGILAREGGMDTVIAYEVATFESAALHWKPQLEVGERDSVRSLCAGPAANTAVVVREFSGCAVTMTGQRDTAHEWTVQTLAEHGSVIGRPKNFWTQDPSRSRPPEGADCKARRVVLAEVLPVSAVCAKYQGVDT